MRRIMLLVTVGLVMAAMMLAVGAAPGSAQATHVSGPGTFDGVPCTIKAVITPSGNANATCQYKKTEGGNEGGSGGGGATIERGTANLGPIPLEAQGVITPSGNGTLQGHYNAQGN